jgi:hypothetical protein
VRKENEWSGEERQFHDKGHGWLMAVVRVMVATVTAMMVAVVVMVLWW